MNKEDVNKRSKRLERKRVYYGWILNKLFSGVGLGAKALLERRARVLRGVILSSLVILSVFIYWLCFINTSEQVYVSLLVFFLYLVPVEIASVMYGWGGGIICFSAVFLATVIASPSYAYFPFYHLVALYFFANMKKKRLCMGVWRSILWGIISGVALSGVYYLVFALITEGTFSQVSSSVVLFRLIVIVPQSILMCLFLNWFDNRCSDEFRIKIGCSNRDFKRFIDQVEGDLKKGARSISGKIFALLLTEAVIMGIAAAFFANSLIPKMLEDYHNMAETAFLEEEFKPDRKPDIKPDEFNKAFETARAQGGEHEFSYNDKGIAFDLKLIMMLLCVVHPIVMLCNFAGQKLIATPITDITNVVSEFNEDKQQRLLALRKLSELNIHSEDEIEMLYRMIHKMSRELNSYIDEIQREQQLKEDLRVAKAASEAKSTFLSNVSHEIRTPINAVIGLDEMILRESDNENIRRYAIDIKNSGKTLLALINDLLDFSKIEAGKMDIIPAEYELSSVINDLINMISVKASEKGLKLEVDVSRDIPHLLVGDEIRLKQCILNILNNAVKYTHEGSVRLEVTSRSVSEQEIVLGICVRDTGIGIKEEDLSKLNTPFERLEESRNRSIEGTGLGMSIVTRLLDMMGSKLCVKSEYGKGSEFSFEVLQRVVDSEPIGDFNETYLKSINSSERYKPDFCAPDARILVVDDTPMNLKVIKGLLKPLQITVDTALSGAECLQMVLEAHYDIIFMDQRMPEMDGTQTLYEFRKLSKEENPCFHTPVVMLTANVVAGVREKYIHEGFSDYLSKPVDAIKLEEMIRKLLPKEKVLQQNEIMEEETAEDDSAFLLLLQSVDAIDSDAALSNCVTMDILKNAVYDFYISLKTVPDKIEHLLQDNNIRDYTITVHALKSSARLIGALKLSELAAELEKKGDQEDLDGIHALNDEMLLACRSLYDKLKAVCEVGKPEEDGEMIDAGALAEAYAGIREAVEAFDFDTADEIIKMLSDYRMPDDHKDRFIRIRDLVIRLDRDSLMEELQ